MIQAVQVLQIRLACVSNQQGFLLPIAQGIAEKKPSTVNFLAIACGKIPESTITAHLPFVRVWFESHCAASPENLLGRA